MAARMQPAMPRYARAEEAAGAVWEVDVPPACHCSARVTCGPLLLYPPTARHADGAGQATEGPLMSKTPGMSGVGWMRHRAPFHRSAKVCGGKPPGPKASPTLVQADSEVQDTLFRKSPCVPGGLGVCSTLQVVPVSRSASVPVFVLPVAMQAVTDWHQTPKRTAPGVCWVGVRCSVQLVPFHRSANVPVGGLPAVSAAPEIPTPMQAAGAGQATPR